MPGPTRRIPGYRLHRPTGQAVVTLARKDHYLGRHGTPASYEKYTRLTNEFFANGSITVVRRQELTVAELASAFLAHAGSPHR